MLDQRVAPPNLRLPTLPHLARLPPVFLDTRWLSGDPTHNVSLLVAAGRLVACGIQNGLGKSLRDTVRPLQSLQSKELLRGVLCERWSSSHHHLDLNPNPDTMWGAD